MLVNQSFYRKLAILIFYWVALFTWASAQDNPIIKSGISDPKATKQTQALFDNLLTMSGKSILFGHQDALAYGVTWTGELNRSDIKDVCGVYPAMFGWDLGKLSKNGVYNIDSVSFIDMKRWIRQASKWGALIRLAGILIISCRGGMRGIRRPRFGNCCQEVHIMQN